MRPTHFVANDISPLTGEREQLKGAPVVVLGRGGMVGDCTVVILETFDVLVARAAMNGTPCPRKLWADMSLAETWLSDDAQAVLARHGIARDAKFVCCELMLEDLQPVPEVN